MDTSKRFTIRAYCGTCGKMLLESNPTSKKKLKEFWDEAVMQAPLCIFCKECHPDSKINFDITFKIYDSLKGKEYEVEKIIKSKLDFGQLDGFTDKHSLEDAVNSSGELTNKEKFEMTLGMRSRYNKSLQQ